MSHVKNTEATRILLEVNNLVTNEYHVKFDRVDHNGFEMFLTKEELSKMVQILQSAVEAG